MVGRSRNKKSYPTNNTLLVGFLLSSDALKKEQ